MYVSLEHIISLEISLELCPDMCICLYLIDPQSTPGGQEEHFREARLTEKNKVPNGCA